VRRLHAATLSQIEEAASPVSDTPVPEVLRAPPSGEPAAVSGLPLTASEEERGHVRASFIAAARRAVQNAAPEPAEESAPAPLRQEAGDSDPSENKEADDALPPSLFERLRRTLDSQRRPFLLGLAFLILAAGTVRILSGDHGVSAIASPSPDTSQEILQAPEPRSLGTADSSAPQETASLFQASTLSPESSASVPLAAGKFLVDPATVVGIPADVPAGLRQAALSGDAAALYEIGARLAEGRGLAQDMAAAARLLERSSQAGLPPAQERLATMFEKGLGVARDFKQAVFWYERAALGGHVRAMHNLATLLASGAAGKPDYATALRWYTEAAEAGFQDSQFNMGILLARGIGSKPDLSKAFQWFSLAAAQGDAEAARKRDELALRLSPADLKAARAALDLWRPRAADPVANQPPSAAPEWTAALDRSSGNRS
jgi:localization factor PodJL